MYPCRKSIKNNYEFNMSKLLGMVAPKVNLLNRYREFKI